MTKRVVIIGAGAAGLMAADVLSRAADVVVDVYEAKPSVGRKLLMAGKGGLNITHSEPFADFIQRYDQPEWLSPMLAQFDANDIRAWMKSLHVDSFVGTSGRIFPSEMKAAPLLRHWLADLKSRGVRVHCRHYWCGFTDDGGLRLAHSNETQIVHADATILALGGGSWASLGSDGLWFDVLAAKNIPLTPFAPSNCGFDVSWSTFMRVWAGQPIKNIQSWVGESISSAEIMLTQTGVEGGAIYAHSRDLRAQMSEHGKAVVYIDLLPQVTHADLVVRLQSSAKHSLANVWRKAGLDGVKAALIREYLTKEAWHDARAVADASKKYPLTLTGMSPIDEAISTAGGVRQDALDDALMLRALPSVFCCGEMLDWDAPTGGYLLSACFASGRHAARGVLDFLAQP